MNMNIKERERGCGCGVVVTLDGPYLERWVINAKGAEGYRTFFGRAENKVWCERWENDFVIDCFMFDELGKSKKN